MAWAARAAFFLALVAALAAAGGYAVIASYAPRATDHVSPLTVRPPASPNWALAFPPSVSGSAAPTHRAPVWAATSEEVARAIVTVAEQEPRTTASVSGGAPLWIARSAVIGWPDLISAEPLELGEGRVSVAIYSRSVYGYSDLGVNAARVARWIEGLDARLERAD